MREYRFYIIGANGHIDGPGTDIAAQDDPAALLVARQQFRDNDVEIWEGPRLVAYVVADETKQMPPSSSPDADQYK